MKNYLLIILLLFISNCNLKKVENHHGIHFLEKKQKNLVVDETNSNEIMQLLGPPSTKDTFDNDIWIYIERVISNNSIMKLGTTKLVKNDVLILEINSRGILVKKDFYNKENMKDVKFSKDSTKRVYSKESFVYEFLSSLRQKLNDPLGKRKTRRTGN